MENIFCILTLNSVTIPVLVVDLYIPEDVYKLLDLICWYFIKNFHIYVNKECWSVTFCNFFVML